MHVLVTIQRLVSKPFLILLTAFTAVLGALIAARKDAQYHREKSKRAEKQLDFFEAMNDAQYTSRSKSTLIDRLRKGGL